MLLKLKYLYTSCHTENIKLQNYTNSFPNRKTIGLYTLYGRVIPKVTLKWVTTTRGIVCR